MLRDVDAAAQADLAQKLLQQRALARSKEELGMPVRPAREARVPLQLSEAQLECYRDVLARRFDVLADPKRPRHSAQRTSEMRALCAELRKVSLSALPLPLHVMYIAGHAIQSVGRPGEQRLNCTGAGLPN